ncbi:endonuclease I [Chryseobacterium sp. T16E-39]|uniref:endonuclease n=1 Tax=Chryseobacterium sp. T16E-39 TaxID=2015076 RepID=UPI000B5B3D3A|nr:endonuclease [Chryseobacterium sp. T16E-39]ASK29146.1 endonuclease I [Chryseobacterium sp. T16E-39]
MKKVLLPVILISSFIFSQAPAGYYDGTTGLTGYALKSKLHDIISVKNISWHYGDLPAYYNQTDLDIYYDHDASNTTLLLDMYSEIPTGPDAYEYTSAQLISSAATEGLGYNREHMMPQSTFYSNYPMYSDLFYVIPTDAKINQLRSNYPYGISSTTPSNVYNIFTNSSKIGKSAIPNYVYTGRVYEPIDEFKGDIARSLLYFAVRYEGKLGTFKYNNNTNPVSDSNPLDGTEEKAFDDAYIAMLLQWNAQDPVSQKEIDRNNSVYSIQKNRNPFIDHPQWVSDIWGQVPDNIAPQTPGNLTAVQTSAYFTTLSWSPSSSSDVIGYKIYQNGIWIASTRNTSISIDHLSPSTNYTYTVKAYDNGYLLSPDSNIISVNTLASDIYAKDLFVSKYLEGTSDNKAIEITNRTGHEVNLNDYRLSIQFYSSTGQGYYYFPAPYELEGSVANNQTFIIVNPNANFSCFTNNEAKFVTAAPQMTYTGSQYIELRYKQATVDAIGEKSQFNSSQLSNVSLYRKTGINQPTSTFNINEWNTYSADYCEDVGVLSVPDVHYVDHEGSKIYPNPVDENIFVSGRAEDIEVAKIIDWSGRLLRTEKIPFKNKRSIPVQDLQPGQYLLQLDHKTYKFIKK